MSPVALAPVDPKASRDVCAQLALAPEAQRAPVLQHIKSEMLRRGAVTSAMFPALDLSALRTLVRLFDVHVFGGWLKRTFPDLRLDLDLEGNSVLGTCTLTARTQRISVNAGLLTRSLASGRPEMCNGLACRSRLDALVSVVAHELVHLVVETQCRETRSHGPAFQRLARALFGQTHYRHALGRPLADSALSARGEHVLEPRERFRAHQKVAFVARGKRYEGRITKRNPARAQVAVPSVGTFRVPYALLIKVA